MEKPNAATAAWWDGAVPSDARAVKGQMFGHPCAFVNGNMFFGTFGQSVIVRLGAERVTGLAARGPGHVFEPMKGRAWPEYLQLVVEAVDDDELAGLAREALGYTAKLPPKAAKAKARKPAGARPKATPARPAARKTPSRKPRRR